MSGPCWLPLLPPLPSLPPLSLLPPLPPLPLLPSLPLMPPPEGVGSLCVRGSPFPQAWVNARSSKVVVLVSCDLVNMRSLLIDVLYQRKPMVLQLTGSPWVMTQLSS